MRYGFGLLVAVLSGLAACAPSQFPNANTPVPSAYWTVVNQSTNATVTSPTGQSFAVNLKPQGSYTVTFNAASPDGLAYLSWSGAGTFYCYSGVPGQHGYVGTGPGLWPTQAVPVNPPVTPQALTNVFAVPCGAGSADVLQGFAGPAPVAGASGQAVAPASQEVVTATATNASGKTITSQLVLIVQGVGL
jgi:hypothetical protein